jgi:hypothetical protein
MKSIIGLIALSLVITNATEAQTRKKGRAAQKPTSTRKTTAEPPASAPRIIGSQVVLVTKNGDQIKGVLLDLTAYSIKVRAGNLDSVHALDTLASISFGSSQAPSLSSQQQTSPVRPEFLKDADATLGAFQTMTASLRGNADYTEYDYQLRDLRPAAERFTSRYAASDNKTEAQVAALISAALTDYTWARTLWTLKFGRSGDGAASDTDSPAIADVLSLYPDLRSSAASGAKFSVDKLVGGLWRKAVEKTDRARTLITPQR